MAEVGTAGRGEVRNVTITIEEYASLIKKSFRHDMLAEALLGNARLGYTDASLAINGDGFDSVLKTLERDGYDAKLRELRAEEGKG